MHKTKCTVKNAGRVKKLTKYVLREEHHIGLWPICIEVKNEDSIHKSELLSKTSLLEFILWLIG